MTKSLSKKRKRKIAPLSWVIILLFLAGVASSGWKLWQLNQQVQERIVTLNAQKTALSEQERKLQTEIQRLNDPAYIEQLAREELGLVRHGEIAIAPKK